MSRSVLLALSLAAAAASSTLAEEAAKLPPDPEPQPDPGPTDGAEPGPDEGLSPFLIGDAVVASEYSFANPIGFLNCVCREAASRGLRVAGCADAFVPATEAQAATPGVLGDIYQAGWRRYADVGDEPTPDDVIAAGQRFAAKLLQLVAQAKSRPAAA